MLYAPIENEYKYFHKTLSFQLLYILEYRSRFYGQVFRQKIGGRAIHRSFLFKNHSFSVIGNYFLECLKFIPKFPSVALYMKSAYI